MKNSNGNAISLEVMSARQLEALTSLERACEKTKCGMATVHEVVELGGYSKGYHNVNAVLETLSAKMALLRPRDRRRLCCRTVGGFKKWHVRESRIFKN